MALLQFMQAGKAKVAVPTTVHCDHLIQAKTGAVEDLKSANSTSAEVFNFLSQFQINTVLVLETWGRNHSPSGVRELCFPRRE